MEITPGHGTEELSPFFLCLSSSGVSPFHSLKGQEFLSVWLPGSLVSPSLCLCLLPCELLDTILAFPYLSPAFADLISICAGNISRSAKLEMLLKRIVRSDEGEKKRNNPENKTQNPETEIGHRRADVD